MVVGRGRNVVVVVADADIVGMHTAQMSGSRGAEAATVIIHRQFALVENLVVDVAEVAAAVGVGSSDGMPFAVGDTAQPPLVVHQEALIVAAAEERHNEDVVGGNKSYRAAIAVPN